MVIKDDCFGEEKTVIARLINDHSSDVSLSQVLIVHNATVHLVIEGSLIDYTILV